MLLLLLLIMMNKQVRVLTGDSDIHVPQKVIVRSHCVASSRRSNEATKECFVAYLYATRDHQQPRTLGIAHGGGGGGGIAFCSDR